MRRRTLSKISQDDVYSNNTTIDRRYRLFNSDRQPQVDFPDIQ